MADFKTHLAVGSTVSGVVAIGCLVAGIATPKEVAVLFCAGTIGGVLPDIDSDHATPVRLLFDFLAIVIAFLTVFSRSEAFSIVELVCLWIIVDVTIRYVPYKIFAKFTVHRGIFHSLLAAIFFGFLTTAAASRLFGLDAQSAWLVGSFVSLGYVTHLLLDEIYSVDLMGANIKQSFGTAIKFASFKNWKASIALGAATVALFFMATPAPDLFLRTMASKRTYESIQARLLPKDRWFNFEFPRMPASPDRVGGLTSPAQIISPANSSPRE
jgi:membrane-bound metal-dependent hydrolase YbcI (DUF457 family)